MRFFLATSIHQNTQARLSGIPHPRTQMVTGNLLQTQGLPTSYRISRGDLPTRDNYSGRTRDSGGRVDERFVGDEIRGSGQVQNCGPRGRPSYWGCLARPDRNRQPYIEGIQCAACRRAGHVAKQCDMLATAICLERYTKKDLSSTLREAIKQEWLAKWKDGLGNPNSTPHKVMRTYVESLDITVAGLDEEMDWSCWDCDKDEESE